MDWRLDSLRTIHVHPFVNRESCPYCTCHYSHQDSLVYTLTVYDDHHEIYVRVCLYIACIVVRFTGSSHSDRQTHSLRYYSSVELLHFALANHCHSQPTNLNFLVRREHFNVLILFTNNFLGPANAKSLHDIKSI